MEIPKHVHFSFSFPPLSTSNVAHLVIQILQCYPVGSSTCVIVREGCLLISKPILPSETIKRSFVPKATETQMTSLCPG